MSKKQFIIIDGLARSGTTLLHSILNSQELITSYRGAFIEPLCLKNIFDFRWFGNSWVEKNLNTKDIYPELINFQKTYNYNKYFFDQKEFKNKSISALENRSQFQSFNLFQWEQIINEDISSLEDLDKIYTNILNHTENDILSFRWNNCAHYIHSWITRKNHKWICVIRNPEDRATSYLKSHKVSLKKSLKLSIQYARKLERLSENQNILILHYEDLITDPMETLSTISKFLGVSYLNNIYNIKNSDGFEYRNETSDLIDKKLDRKKGQKFEGFINPKTYNNDFSFSKELNHFKIYKRYY